MNGLDRRRGAIAAAAVIAPLLVVYAIATALADDRADQAGSTPPVIAGSPGGFVTTPSPEASPTPETPRADPSHPASPTPRSESPTPASSEVAAATDAPEPTPTAAPPAPAPPRPAATPPPATPPPPTPTPAVAVAVASSPADAVVAFYDRVAAGDFDAAYRLWSDRMKATYPRDGNLDGRFAETASITFFELRVASQSADTATVQANFTERYDGGGSRDFIGYWRLINVNGAWLLDEPHY